MPLYEYQCDVCANRFERIQKFSDPPVDACPACGGAVRKLLSSPAIQFKGSGWYITDYAKKPSTSGDGKGAQKGAGDDHTSTAASDKPAGAGAGSTTSADSPTSKTTKSES